MPVEVTGPDNVGFVAYYYAVSVSVKVVAECYSISGVGAVVVYVEYCDFPIRPLELDGCDVVSVHYVNYFPVFGFKPFVDPNEQIWESSVILFFRNIGLKLAGVLMALKAVVYDSCISIMSYLPLTFSFIMSKCAFSDLLRLICMILIFMGFASWFTWSFG